MHESVLNFVQTTILGCRLGDVLEVGAFDVNGSARPIIEPRSTSYIATDMRAGPGVDRVVDCTQLLFEFGRDRFDTVVSLEMLEHVSAWRMAVAQMKAVTRPGGRVLLTTRSLGFPLHDYPSDYWRFSTADMSKIWGDWAVEFLVVDPQAPGVFVCARKPLPVDLEAITVASMQ